MSRAVVATTVAAAAAAPAPAQPPHSKATSHPYTHSLHHYGRNYSRTSSRTPPTCIPIRWTMTTEYSPLSRAQTSIRACSRPSPAQRLLPCRYTRPQQTTHAMAIREPSVLRSKPTLHHPTPPTIQPITLDSQASTSTSMRPCLLLWRVCLPSFSRRDLVRGEGDQPLDGGQTETYRRKQRMR